jgi:hypothetical protein
MATAKLVSKCVVIAETEVTGYNKLIQVWE